MQLHRTIGIGELSMSSQDVQMLPLRCPRCGHDEAKLFLHSATVVTVKCGDCDHSWSVDIAALPDDVRPGVTLAPIQRERINRSA
jgi:hypothetical protein